VSEGDRTDFRSLYIGYHPSVVIGADTAQVLTLVFDEAQTKDNLHRLDVVVTYTWDRDLS
jgi:hypothetical protein